MRCRLPPLVLLPLPLLASAVRAEYTPGFTLYGHATAERILEVDVGEDGRAVVVVSFRGPDAVGDLVEVDADLLLRTRYADGDRRAFLFLSDGKPILGAAGVAWIHDGMVILKPDDGWCTPLEYRPPAPALLRESLRTVWEDIAEVSRIAALEPSRERALAASDLLARSRTGLDWYVVSSVAVGIVLEVPWKERFETRLDYGEELLAALRKALGPLAAEEVAALRERTAILDPGPLRRLHLDLLRRAEIGLEAFELAWACYDTATNLRERLMAARVMLMARPDSAFPMLLPDLEAEHPELAQGLLCTLSPAALRGDVPADRFLDETARLGREVLGLSHDTVMTNLAGSVCSTLHEGNRDEDRPLLLAFARSEHASRVQALAYLNAWAGNDWEADDGRWGRLVTGK